MLLNDVATWDNIFSPYSLFTLEDDSHHDPTANPFALSKMVGSELSLSSLLDLFHMDADTTLAVKDTLPSLHHMALHSQRYQKCNCTRKYIGNHQRPVR